MVGKINSYTNKFKAMFFSLAILFLPMTLYAFETIKNVPSRNAYFTGREAYLNDMQKILSQYGEVYLTGYGGIGKSQLAKEYCYVHNQEYDLIWWFDLRGDLEIQYENLLTHLSNNEKFKKLLHVNIKDIAPSALIDFTNSLLSQYGCKWLLIFDNVLNNKDIKLPKTKTSGQHIIVTTREQQIFGNKALTLGPFTNQESELFLLKIHPEEKKEEIVKLCKTLHNYPLALAQISESILMHKDKIEEYLKKHNEISAKPMPMHSDITQEYNDNYHEVLRHTLQDIEQKDKGAARVLYMLVLLKTDITKKTLKNLFEDEIEDEIIALSKYGVVQTTSFGNSQVLNIHDVIREEAIKKFNSKDITYKKEIILILSKYFNKFCSEKNLLHYLNNQDATNNQVAPLYAFIDVALQNDVIDDGVINAVIVSLKLNDCLVNKHANYALYQQIANKIYGKNIENIISLKKALLYANLVYSDFIFESEERLLEFEKEILHLLGLIEGKKNHEEVFFIYTYLSKLYLFLGDLKEAKACLKKAEKNINYIDNAFSLLQYWWSYARVCYELREINEGTTALNTFEKLRDQLLPGKIGRFSPKFIRIRLITLSGQNNMAKKEIEEAIKDAAAYYNNIPSSVMGNLEFTKSLIYFQDGQYNLAESQCKHAINITKKANGGEMVSYVQANMHIMLGRIYEKKGCNNLALEEYKECLKFYNKRSYGRITTFHEYGELLSNLCVIYYKQKNYAESKFYLQKLVANFGLEHEFVENLIKKLPLEYMYQVSDLEK